jgi:hypothetical protein
VVDKVKVQEQSVSLDRLKFQTQLLLLVDPVVVVVSVVKVVEVLVVPVVLIRVQLEVLEVPVFHLLFQEHL